MVLLDRSEVRTILLNVFNLKFFFELIFFNRIRPGAL
jgi:hypothetical protein